MLPRAVPNRKDQKLVPDDLAEHEVREWRDHQTPHARIANAGPELGKVGEGCDEALQPIGEIGRASGDRLAM